MNKIIFAVGLLLTSTAFAATGTGEAQAELTNPLTVTSSQDVDFGTIAIDPASGPQTLLIGPGDGRMTCPTGYVCTGIVSYAVFNFTGAPNATINIDLTGSTATLDDGSGNTLTFDPIMFPAIKSTTLALDGLGSASIQIAGSLDLTGNEVAGIYTSQNGSGYQVTVNY